MSTRYGSVVFYGTYVDAGSTLGQRLDEFIDKHGGSPAPCGVRGVEVGTAGMLNGDPLWITIQARGSAHYSNAGENVAQPIALCDKIGCDKKILGALARVGAMKADLPRIGWHFAATVG